MFEERGRHAGLTATTGGSCTDSLAGDKFSKEELQSCLSALSPCQSCDSSHMYSPPSDCIVTTGEDEEVPNQLLTQVQ
eukprot:424051-Hanusia_phi.AAC.1